jgi:hypothetical protein
MSLVRGCLCDYWPYSGIIIVDGDGFIEDGTELAKSIISFKQSSINMRAVARFNILR